MADSSLAGGTARRIIRAARSLSKRVATAVGILRTNERDIETAHAALVDALTDRSLAALPLDAIRTATTGRITLAPLTDAGFERVGDVTRLTEAELRGVPGVGDATARAVVAAVDHLRRAAREQVRFRIALDPTDAPATALLQHLARHDTLRQAASGVRNDLFDLVTRLPAELETARPAGNPLVWLFTGGEHRELALDAVGRLREIGERAEASGLAQRVDEIERVARLRPADPWPDFERRAADYYALLSEFVPSTAPVQATQGYLTDEVVQRVEGQALDDSLRRVDLRGYQSFGARFALAQRRVIIGDEMGLGKTIQALAGLAHLRATSPGHQLVVCPASVLANWEREIRTRTSLAALVLHGPDRQDEVTRWLAEGPVAVTTFETLRLLELPRDLRLSALVVDEAHYVKNPRTARSRAIKVLTGLADHVWFLTGTPMENDVEEFRALIRYLQSDLAPADGPAAAAGSVAFRRSVSPVYLRRNTEDVLVELPERIDVDEWVRFTPADEARYRTAVASGNFMAMRQAGFANADPRHCAKTERLLDLVTGAAANGRKTLVYSFFRSAIEVAGRALPGPAFGPITGDMPPAKRQQVVDAFTAHAGPAILLSQIQAGGVGLNIQAASVVIVCEPQLTPTSEDQAIARAHRMGQVRTVQVHRLLNEDAVDERVVELLRAKRDAFDAYARRSALAEATDAAVDLSLEKLADRIVRAEQERLAVAGARDTRSTDLQGP